MDGGSVSFQIADGWGDMQRDPLEHNYINVTTRGGSLVDVDYGNRIVIANLNTLRPEGTVTFSYGGSRGRSASKGAEADTETGISTFTIQSDGNGDGRFKRVVGSRALADVEETNPDGLGEVFTDNPGELKVRITGAADGTGTATVATEETKAGTQTYKDEQGEDVQDMRIHAGDDSTYLKFTYTPGQTIEEGQLTFTVPSGWTNPQGEDPGAPGYTRVRGGQPAQFDGEGSLTVDIITLDKTEPIEIHYGEYQFGGTEGGAIAPDVATPSSEFDILIKGTKNGTPDSIRDHRDTMLDVEVWSQASGGGMAMIEVTDDIGELSAGDMGRELTITYTASGELKNGALKLTTPEEWSAPAGANVEISSTGSTGRERHGGDYGEDDTLPDDLKAREVIVEGVNLDAGQTVTFVYKGVMVQPTAATGVAFGVASMGSEGPGMDFIDLDDLTVDVGEAAAGSGMAMVDPMFVTAGSSGNILTFTYTVAGEATYPRDIRIAVPEGWSKPGDVADEGTYTVTLMRGGKAETGVVEGKSPIEGSMVARVQAWQ